MKKMIIGVALAAWFSTEAAGQQLNLASSAFWTGLNDVKISGSHAYCAFQNGLEILDITDRENPQFVSRLLCYGQGKAVDIAGSYAFLADGDSGLQVIDIANPADPALAGRLIASGSASNLFISGAYCYLTDGGLQIIDISNAAAPVLVSSSYFSAVSNDVFIRGDYAYVVAGEDGMNIIDVSDRANQVLVGNFDQFGSARGVFVSGNYAYLAHGYAGLKIINIANPSNPVLVGAYNPGTVSHVFVRSVYCYLVYGEASGRFCVFNVSNPSNPTYVSFVNLPGESARFTVDGGEAFVANETYGLQVIGIANPGFPAIVGSYRNQTMTYDVDLRGDIGVLTGARWPSYVGSELSIIDITNPLDPIRVAALGDSIRARQVVFRDERMFTAGWPQLAITDVTSPAAPDILGRYSYSFESGRAVDLRDTIAVLLHSTCDYEMPMGGIEILDIADESAPVMISGIDIPDQDCGLKMATRGDYAFIVGEGVFSRNTGWLTVVDISDYANPGVVSSNQWLRGARGIALSGNYAFIIDNGLRVFDISDPVSLTFVTSVSISNPRDIIIDGNYALIAADAEGIKIVDITDPSNPSIMESFDTPGNASGLAAQEGNLYVADTYSLLIYQADFLGIKKGSPLPENSLALASYPNPFNGVTTLTYRLEVGGHSKLTIYDLLGHRIGVLYEGKQEIGEHDLAWDARRLASGIYFARLETAGGSRIAKLVLLK